MKKTIRPEAVTDRALKRFDDYIKKAQDSIDQRIAAGTLNLKFANPPALQEKIQKQVRALLVGQDIMSDVPARKIAYSMIYEAFHEIAK